VKLSVPYFLFQAVHVLIDCAEGYDFDILRQYLKLFPDEALAKLIQPYLAYLGIPLSSEEETATTPSGSLDDVFGAITVRFVYSPLACTLLDFIKQKTAVELQSSIFARRVMTEVYLQDQDYQATITVSQAGLELVNSHREDTGSDLILCVDLLLGSSVDDSVQCSKSVQCRSGNIARSSVSSKTPYPSSPHTRGGTLRRSEQCGLPYGSWLCPPALRKMA
jgi:hypothetical protein